MKRVLSLLLAIVMVFGLIPMAAFAEGNPTISFETTFADTMTVGDTFTVTGSLANNPGIATMTLSLQWNEDAVKFSGFETEYDEDEEADVLKSDVFGAMATVVNHDLGIIAGARTQGTNTKKNGTLFVANFEIVGSGDLDIALKDADATEFEMANADMEDIAVTFDYSAIENLSVAGAETEGPAIPDGAPFTAITTDAGAAIAIERQDDVNDLPYYIVTIPATATTAYVTAPDQVVMADYNTGEMKATAYAAEVANGWNQLYISYDYEDTADGPKVEIPMNMVAQDWNGEVELCFVEEDGNLSHAFGIEDSSFACLGWISFRYGTSSAPVEPEEPTVSEIPAGAAFVDMIARVNGEDKPVTIQEMDDHYKVLVPLGTTAVYVIYDEGVPVVDEFGYAAVRVTGVDGVTEDGYSQTTSGGKTTVGLLMNKAAANGAPVTINLISLDYENRSAVGIKKADESAEDWFSFTYQLADGEHFAILPLSTDSVGYYVTGDPIASNGYTFTVELEEGYQADSNFAVKVNGETVATAPGEITLETVSEDIRVTVEGVSKAADSTTDLIFTVDLTDAPEGMWGDIMIQDNEYNFIEETVESGKKSSAAIAARNNQYTKVRIYGINTDLIAGWDINGTVYPVESGKVYTDYLTIWPRGTYMQVECSSTEPITVNIKPVLAEVPTTYTITAQQPTGGTVTVLDQDGNEITQAAEGDAISLHYEADEGYRFKHYLINGTVVTEDDLGMTNGLYLMPAEDITVSAVFEAKHTCTYDREVVDEKYLKSEATCQTGAVYYKSCECELFDKSETAATFASGEKVDHDYVDGVCKWCGEAATEPILSFTAGGQTLEAVTAEDYCSEFEVTAQKLTVTVPAGVNTVTINCAASMCAYIDHVSSDLSPSGKSAEIDLTQDLTFVCVPVTLDDGSDAYYHVYFEQEAGDVDPEPEDPAVTPGYFFATSADVSTENGGTAVVSVKITGHSDENITGYNAYDVTLTFDETKLEYVDFDGAVKSDNGQVKVEGNTIRIVGCGADKDFGTEIARLTFKTKAEGAAQVTVSKAQVSDKEESVTEDIPEATPKHDENDTTADTTPDQSVVLVPYTVTKPNFVSGETSVLHGEDYTFSYTDTVNYTYTGLKVTVGGTDVTPTEADGVYTIANVTGAVTIEVTQTANSYTVTKPANVTGPDKATYGEDYIFTVTPSEGKVIDTVTVTAANGTIPYTISENGEYVIKGTDISGPFTITVTEKDKPVTTTTITFTGVEEAEVVGGLTQTAPIGKEFTFQLNKDEKFTYTAKVSETDLVETPATDEAPAFYTIPAELVVEGGVTVTIAKAEIRNLKVEVSTYFNTDGAVMFLVIAKDGEKVLTYGEEAMFYSDKYALTGEEAGAYCWLVSSGDDADTVKAAAVASIKAAEETVDAPVVAYDCDVNQTTKVDVNDAQLAYDMYKGVYGITESVTMDKFLEADISTDRKLDVNDVAAIINFIVNGTSN